MKGIIIMSLYPRLRKNIIEVIKEAQLKMGYESHAISLNYPLSSLCHLTENSVGTEEMKKLLADFFTSESEIFGITAVTEKEGIFTLTISSKGVDYVHDHTDSSEFIARLIEAVRSHSSYEQVLEVFKSFSDDLHIEQMNNDEFDYLIYFENGSPDDFMYCITLDFDHVTYHRFTKEDYIDFGF